MFQKSQLRNMSKRRRGIVQRHLSTISDRLNFAAKRSFSNIGKAYKNRIYYKTDSRKPLSEG